jgi:hypothetical protein
LRRPERVQMGGSLAVSSLNTVCETVSVGGSSWSTVFNEISRAPPHQNEQFPFQPWFLVSKFNSRGSQRKQLSRQANPKVTSRVCRFVDHSPFIACPKLYTTCEGVCLPQRCYLYRFSSVSSNLGVDFLESYVHTLGCSGAGQYLPCSLVTSPFER